VGPLSAVALRQPIPHASRNVYARMSATSTYAERFAAGLKQSWAEEKAAMARKAVKAARWERQSRLAQQLDLLAQERLELLAMAGRTVPYSRGIPCVRSGRFQSGSW
jgi:hypothetical protein